jgi:drug/metabolite transporter (DMT)-like permease
MLEEHRREGSTSVMTLFALALILAAGFFHATWNLLAKRAGNAASAPAFVWLCSVISMLIFAPLVAAVFLSERSGMTSLGLLFVFGTGVLHTGYFLTLQEGYRVGDLSVVYPLARGTGPLIASVAAIAFFSERPGPIGGTGLLLIVGGVFLLAWEPSDGSEGSAKKKRLAILFGLLTGVFVASYTLWDKYAVSALSLSPILYYWGSLLVEALLLSPVALRDRDKAWATWRGHQPEALGIAILSPLSYILVLTALVFTPVSQVAPAREVSILIGTVLGGRLFAEGGLRRRLVASGLMVAGIVALALG